MFFLSCRRKTDVCNAGKQLRVPPALLKKLCVDRFLEKTYKIKNYRTCLVKGVMRLTRAADYTACVYFCHFTGHIPPLFYLLYVRNLLSGCPDSGRRDWQLESLYAVNRDRPDPGGLRAVTLFWAKQEQRILPSIISCQTENHPAESMQSTLPSS
ncbi:MAG: hypothetical protein CSA32_01950 [Desulfobulbus propionicus]|nr:MAG: hypothetical protein CSA32_01950 [Desulfobulbus propionicus]